MKMGPPPDTFTLVSAHFLLSAFLLLSRFARSLALAEALWLGLWPSLSVPLSFRWFKQSAIQPTV